MNLNVTSLTPESFAPYGTIIEQPSSPAEGAGEGWSWWSEAAVIPQIDAPYAVGYLALEPAALQFDWAEYHLESQEVIIPLDQDCLVYVGPAGESPHWDRFEVFHVRSGQAVMLREGVWHGAPLAIDRPLNALVLLRQGTGDRDVYKATREEGSILIVKEQ
jgi:ureidoglycolate hydrolase